MSALVQLFIKIHFCISLFYLLLIAYQNLISASFKYLSSHNEIAPINRRLHYSRIMMSHYKSNGNFCIIAIESAIKELKRVH